jgi:hypothetical protein
MHVDLMRELNSASQVETMWAVQFFAQVIVKLEGGPCAFLEAEGAVLALNLSSSDLNFFHVHTFDGAQPYIWGDAVKLLSQNPMPAVTRLSAALELRECSPSKFPASRVFPKETKDIRKGHDEDYDPRTFEQPKLVSLRFTGLRESLASTFEQTKFKMKSQVKVCYTVIRHTSTPDPCRRFSYWEHKILEKAQC